LEKAESEVIRAIKERRSIFKFAPQNVGMEKIQAILEAGRWAPSWANTQPWEFVVVRDSALKLKISDIVRDVTIVHSGFDGVSVIIVICTDPEKDPYHFVEDGAVATQNMALAAHSLGLASYWTGIFSGHNIKKNSAEQKVKEVLGIPKGYRVVALLPIGIPAYETQKTRNELRDMTHYDQFGNRRTDIET
jgi:nitroreductase